MQFQGEYKPQDDNENLLLQLGSYLLAVESCEEVTSDAGNRCWKFTLLQYEEDYPQAVLYYYFVFGQKYTMRNFGRLLDAFGLDPNREDVQNHQWKPADFEVKDENGNPRTLHARVKVEKYNGEDRNAIQYLHKRAHATEPVVTGPLQMQEQTPSQNSDADGIPF